MGRRGSPLPCPVAPPRSLATPEQRPFTEHNLDAPHEKILPLFASQHNRLTKEEVAYVLGKYTARANQISDLVPLKVHCHKLRHSPYKCRSEPLWSSSATRRAQAASSVSTAGGTITCLFRDGWCILAPEWQRGRFSRRSLGNTFARHLPFNANLEGPIHNTLRHAR